MLFFHEFSIVSTLFKKIRVKANVVLHVLREIVFLVFLNYQSIAEFFISFTMFFRMFLMVLWLLKSLILQVMVVC